MVTSTGLQMSVISFTVPLYQEVVSYNLHLFLRLQHHGGTSGNSSCTHL
jgi:hypothetical protein